MATCRSKAVFGWRRKRSARLQPEAQWIVAVDDLSIRVTDHAGATVELGKGDLVGVVIETNDSGPWGADLWWLLFGADDRLACAFPQGATGETALIDYLAGFPGFDHGEMIRAMGSTGNAVVPVWRRTT